MSDFYWGLIALGVAAVCAIQLHGWWVTRRSAPRQAEPELAKPVDGLEGTQADGLDAGPEDREPDLGGMLDGETRFMVPEPARRPAMDALIDLIANIEPEMPQNIWSGDAVLAALPATNRVGSKPFAVEGFNPATGSWEAPVPGARYIALQAGVQLANRSGALSEIEFSDFVVKTQSLADALDGVVEFPEMADEVARARELDAFATQYDAQLSLNLRAKQAAWSPGYVQQNAARVGFVAGQLPGRMVLPNPQEGLPPILALAFDPQAAMADDPDQSAIRDLRMTLDVPHIESGLQPFERMVRIATSLAQEMDGAMVDDSGQPLNPKAMESIARDLVDLYRLLDERDLAAGSPLARRLFA
jgi:hypothetical protein